MLTRLLISALLVVSFAPPKQGGEISPRELAKLLRTNRSVVLVDVRTPEEHQQERLRDGVLMNFYGPEFHSQLVTLPKNKPIVLYCHSGRRSGLAMKYLDSIGYSRVYNLHGGIVAWKKDRQPVVGP